MSRRSAFVFTIVVLAVSSFATAQPAGSRYGGRLLWDTSGTTSVDLGDTGSTLDLKSGLGIELNATLPVSDRFSVEFSVGTTAPQISVTEESGSIDGGRVWLLPLTAIAQYHIQVYGPWDPYLGLGVSWAIPFYDLSQDLKDAGVERLEFDGKPGGVAQIGTNYQMNTRWYVNLDLRYVGTSLDAQMRTEKEDLPTVSLDTNPFVISLGCGYIF